MNLPIHLAFPIPTGVSNPQAFLGKRPANKETCPHNDLSETISENGTMISNSLLL